jgi:hypothetical protein
MHSSRGVNRCGPISLREASDVGDTEEVEKTVAAKDEEPGPMEECLVIQRSHVRVGETDWKPPLFRKISAICDAFLCLFAYKSERGCSLSHIPQVLFLILRTYIFASLQ